MITPVSRPAREVVDGVLLLDKPEGLSSTSALGRAKFLLNAQKGGHTGTLDPFVTGLLPLCFGEATKFARFLLDAEKRYLATLVLGACSSTGDTEGTITESAPERAKELSNANIHAALQTFLGAQKQTPPMHSAVKIDGVPLYRLARKGQEVERVARDIEIHELRLVDWNPSNCQLVIETAVSKGTYIRVLAEDIGQALGCGAYLTALRRTAGGGYDVEKAIALPAMESLDLAARRGLLLPPESLCAGLREVHLSDRHSAAFAHGQKIALGVGELSCADAASAEPHAVFGKSGLFLGVGDVCLEQGRAQLVPLRLMQRAL